MLRPNIKFRTVAANAMKRFRDRSETGYERHMQLAHMGRNLQTLGRLLVAKED